MEKTDLFLEMGGAIKKIGLKLYSSQQLARLLTYMTDNPLDASSPDIDLTDINFNSGFIQTNPSIDFSDLAKGTVLVIPYYAMSGENNNFSLIGITVQIYLPISSWNINEEIQRPYLTMSRIYKLLNNIRVSGIGLLRFDTFEYEQISETVGLHSMRFIADAVG